MKIKIKDNQTGEVIEIDESELGNYGLSSEDLPTPPKVSTQPVQETPVSIPQPPPDRSILQGNLQGDKLFSGDSLLASVINSVAKPFIKTGQNIAGATSEIVRQPGLQANTQSVEANTQSMIDINKRLQAEKDPNKKKLLIEQSRKISGLASDARDNLTSTAGENPFLNEERLQKASTDPLGYITDQAKESAAVASWGIPFGKAGFLGSKFVAPGAAVGAAQALPDAQSAEDVAMGAVTGGAMGAGLQLGGKILNKVIGGASKISPTLEKGAQKIEQGTRTIRVKPSVYGAGQETAINNTLTKYKIKGSPQQQYEALEPTMGKIEGKIQEIVKTNPEISVTKADIKQSFLNNLKSSLRSKDLTQRQAITEVEGYLNDLVKASGGKGKFTTIDLGRLRELKKLVNEDYGPINKLLETGGALTPRQKVIHAAWDSLDDAVKNASPEMKVLLKDESNLFKSASSLSSARSNPPTFRFMGTSIPAEVTQKGKNVLTDVLRVGGQKTEGISNTATNIETAGQRPLMKTLLGQGGARIANGASQISSNSNNIPNDEQNYNNTQNIQNNSPESTIPQESNYVTGYSPEELYSAYQKAIMAGDKASASQLRTMYEDEIAYQKTQTTSNKPVPAALKQRMDLSTSGLRARQDAEDIFRKDPTIIIKKTVSGGLLSRKFDSAMSRAVEGLLRARSGAAVPDSEVKKYIRDYGPRIGDPEEVALYKLQQLKLDLEDALKNNGNVGADYTLIQ